MENPIANMNDLYISILTNKLSISHIIDIIRVIRIEIEACNEKDKYRILNLFCDWCVHSKLDKNKVAREFHESFKSSIEGYNQDPKGNTIHKCWIELFNGFKSELEMFVCEKFKLSLTEQGKSDLIHIFNAILHMICNIPISITDAKLKIGDEIFIIDKFVVQKSIEDGHYLSILHVSHTEDLTEEEMKGTSPKHLKEIIIDNLINKEYFKSPFHLNKCVKI